MLLILELLLLLLAASLGTFMSEAKNSSFPLTCTNVPYPFGISGKAMKGFEISCNGTSPILQLGKHTYRIRDISLQGKLSIDTGVIFQSCGGDVTYGSGWIDLEGTPYTISDTENSGNMLTTVGCKRTVLIRGLRNMSSSGCSTFYDSSIVNGSCSGLGCCQASIPMGLKTFNLLRGNIDNVRAINPSVYVVDNTCFQTFFVKKSSFAFSTEMLQNVIHGNEASQDRYLMVLDWAIGSETCEEARKKMDTYACKDNSYCYNSTNGVGYRCNCNPGYDGNPYSEDGCKGISLSLSRYIICLITPNFILHQWQPQISFVKKHSPVHKVFGRLYKLFFSFLLHFLLILLRIVIGTSKMVSYKLHMRIIQVKFFGRNTWHILNLESFSKWMMNAASELRPISPQQ